MGRVCSVCSHLERHAIEAALVRDDSNRRVATQYGLTEASVRRHKASHLPAALVAAQDALEIVCADDLLGEVQKLQARALGILSKAEAAGDLRTALSAIREARGGLELMARMIAVAMQAGSPHEMSLAAALAVVDGEILRLEAAGES